jgi:hypothetical protein
VFQENSNVGRMIAPLDGEIRSKSGSGRQAFFNFILEDGSIIQIVHATPLRFGKFKKGDEIAVSTWHHYHVAIRIKNVWYNILEYMDRGIELRPALGLTQHWLNWSTYPDRTLNIKNPEMPYQQPTDPEWQLIQKWQGDNKRLAGIEFVKNLDKDMERLLRVLFRRDQARKKLGEKYWDTVTI